MAGKTHKVQSGEWLSKICHELGRDPKTVWDDGGNTELKSTRPNPNLLSQDDSLFVPEPITKKVSIASDKRHKFIKKGKATVHIKLKLQHFKAKAFEEKYSLEIGGVTIEGTATGGVIEADVPILSHVGTLTFPDSNLNIKIRLGDLSEVEPYSNSKSNIKGVQARLTNMAFNVGPVDGDLGPLTDNGVNNFQSWAINNSPANGLSSGELSAVDSIIGSLTAGSLKKVHGI
ncbi:peptidoglycan-binding domain-containing protein [Paraglaciecola arctica]|uniref:Peptidoglycan binding-like domain-containing protein n=1 Tax=Paraglaciecola arctica BSs20135 TaxID=493475 RepID=K6XG20_9ALTE|nr:hypothetical protein [Paraglaciecola arctica]GAC19604.1 hypothetical protein GARC_2638 [Paraglaciecola arctica BSs20135]